MNCLSPGCLFVTLTTRPFSPERFISLESKVARYGEAVTAVLGKHLGKWTDNLAYSGVHKVEFHGVQHGGQNFIQRAEIEIELQAHE